MHFMERSTSSSTERGLDTAKKHSRRRLTESLVCPTQPKGGTPIPTGQLVGTFCEQGSIRRGEYMPGEPRAYFPTERLFIETLSRPSEEGNAGSYQGLLEEPHPIRIAPFTAVSRRYRRGRDIARLDLRGRPPPLCVHHVTTSGLVARLSCHQHRM